MRRFSAPRSTGHLAPLVVGILAGLPAGCSGPYPGPRWDVGVRSTLDAQAAAWNRGDIDAFMSGYWKSDQLTFSSGGATQRGWQATYDRFVQRYATRAQMGTLTFSDLELTPLGRGRDSPVGRTYDAALVLGRWRLERVDGPLGGNFSLILCDVPGAGWRIIHDHTSLEPAPTATTAPAGDGRERGGSSAATAPRIAPASEAATLTAMNLDSAAAALLAAVRGSARHRPDEALAAALAHFDCVTGTIHRFDEPSRLLHLVAQRGIPDAILDRVRTIPVGKGMAGIAAERREPVQVCNLQTDDSGVAKPAAKLTGVEGSIAVPMLVDGQLRGVLGVAKPHAYDFTAAEQALLLQVAATIGREF